MKTTPYLFILLLSFACRAASPIDIYSESSDTWIERLTVVDAPSWTTQGIRQIAEAFLKANRGFKMGHCLLFASRASAIQTLYGKGGADYGYELWRERASKSVNSSEPIAEVLFFADMAGLRVRDRRGNVSVETLADRRSPFHINFNGARFELLHLTTFNPLSGRSGSPRLYIRSPSMLPLKEGEALTKEAAKLLSIDYMHISIANDVWFADDETFPYAFPFGQPKTPPPQRNDLTGTMLSCDTRPLRCRIRTSEFLR